MLGSYIKTSVRNILKNKVFSVINIAGLAISMSVGLLTITLLSDLLSFDRFHKNKDRIYRITTVLHNNESAALASTTPKIAPMIRQNVTGVEAVSVLQQGFSGDARVGNVTVPLNGLWADNSFFDVFTFSVVEGNLATALNGPLKLVLTEKAAKKLFGVKDALNQFVHIGDRDFEVSAIIKDVPWASHMQFEALGSLSTLQQDQSMAQLFTEWRNISSDYVYVLLSQGGSPRSLQVNLDRIAESENAGANRAPITLNVQALLNIAREGDLHNELGPLMPLPLLWVIASLAMIVILSACFNFTNLSIARALRRSKEVGIRKVMGAKKGQVLFQFTVEAIVLSMLALVVSFTLFLFLRFFFIEITPGSSPLQLSWRTLLAFLGLAFIVGWVAGFFPALFFSRINSTTAIKDPSAITLFQRVSLRKTLIFIQYTFAIIFVASTIIGYNQYRHFITMDLGFHTENIINVRLQGNPGDVVKKEFTEIPEVSEISESQMVTGLGANVGTYIHYLDPSDSLGVSFNGVDEHYVPIHHFQLISGRNLEPKSPESTISEILINEQLLQRFNIGGDDAQKAIGENLFANGKTYTIVGVLKDFHYGGADRPIEPVFFCYAPLKANYLNIKISGGDLSTIMAKIEAAWKRIDVIHPLEARLYQDDIARYYRRFSVITQIAGFLAGMAVFIASMGLFGMVVFTMETRSKELSLRKVLGASESSLVYLLSRGFIWLLLVSAGVALPATYLLFERFLLPSISYHAPVSFTDLSLCLVVVIGIALILIFIQALGISRTNPAEVLRGE